MRGKLASAIGATILSLGLGSSAFGALLVDFKPDPISVNVPELTWAANTLNVAAGAQGNGDGVLPSALQIPGGLLIQTPFEILGIPGSAVNLADPTHPSTTFFDVTLELNLLQANAPILTSGPLVVQNLGAPTGAVATFALKSTDPGPGGRPVTLLEGTIGSAVFFGLLGQQTGSVMSTDITYTGGVIFQKLQQAVPNPPGGVYSGGTASWSLLDISNPQTFPTGGLAVSNGQMANFAANLTGMFSTPTIPEPASMTLVALGAAGILARRRRA